MSKYALLGALVLALNVPFSHAATPAPFTSTKELLDRSIRFAVLTVPLADKAPTVDGTVDNAEWAGASLISDTISDFENTDKRSGLPPQYRARYWIQYTADAIYVAARFDLPSWAPAPGASSTTHDGLGKDDVVDIFLSPKCVGEYHLCGNAIGTTMDRNLADASVVYRWEPKTEYKARVIDGGGWEAEYKIPFSELNAKTPEAGEVWRGQFVYVRHVPFGNVSMWSYMRNWRQPSSLGQNIGTFIFGGKPAAVQFTTGANEIGQKPIEFRVVGQPKGAVKIDAKLYKRSGGLPKPTDPGLVAMLADWLEKMNVGGSDYWGMKWDDVVALAMKQLTPLDGYVNITKGENGLDVVRCKPTDQGEYLLTYKITDGEGDAMSILAAGVLPFRIEPPVSVSIKPRVLKQGGIQVETDLSGLDMSVAKQVKVNIAPVGGATIAQESAPVKSTFERVMIGGAKDWPAGTYLAHADVVDGAGKVLGSAEEKLDKKDVPQWWSHPEGLEPEVPEPWTPVEAQANDHGATVKIWNRVYTFNGLPVPASVESRRMRLSDAEPEHPSEAILAAPMQLKLTAGGQPAQWKNTSFKIIEQKPSQVTFESENTSGAYVLHATTRVEFDGMIRVDMSLTSADGTPQSIDKLDFIIPFKPDKAELLSNYRKAQGPGKTVTRYLGKVPQEPWKFPVFYTQFVGTSTMGIEWFCDNMKGWRIKKGDEGTEIVRGQGQTTETFHFVDHETKVDKEKLIAIAFGLIVTPTKQARTDPKVLRFDQNAHFPLPIGTNMKGTAKSTQADIDGWYRRMKFARLFGNMAFAPGWTGVEWFNYPVDVNSDVGKRLKFGYDAAHSLGQLICPHGGWISMSTQIPEWSMWGHEMIKEPAEGTLGRSFYACYNSPYTDFMVANFAANVRGIGIDGVRFDTISPQPECMSMYHGCGWVGENGQVYGSQAIFATREFFKRMYRVVHGGVKEHGLIYLPVAGPPINAIDSFVDIHEIGEGSFEKAPTLKEGYPQSDVRVRMVGTAYGFVTSNNLKGEPLLASERIGALLVAGGEPRMGGVGHPGMYYRGYQKTPLWFPDSIDIWDTWEWIDRGHSAIWRPYWENQDTIKVSAPKLPDGKDPEIYASYYYVPGKRIVVIVDQYEQQPLENVGVTLDLAKLGFKGGEKLYAEDAITREPVELVDGAMKLGFLAQRWRMIKISGDVPRYVDSNLGPNLLPAGALDSADGVTITSNTGAADGKAITFDTSVLHSGKASMKLRKDTEVLNQTAAATLAPLPVEPGTKYVITGYIRIDDALKAPLEGAGGNPRPDYSFATVAMAGDGLTSDPPQEFSRIGGSFPINERTPGWMRFVLPFEAGATAKNVTINIALQGIGTVWVDDIAVQKVVAK